MTNRENLIKLLQESGSDIGKFLVVLSTIINNRDYNMNIKWDSLDDYKNWYVDNDLSEKINYWSNLEHIDDVPMPELKPGMFVYVNNTKPCGYYSSNGVISHNPEKGDIVIYETGTWDRLEYVKDYIEIVFDESVVCFDSCKRREKENVLWRKKGSL